MPDGGARVRSQERARWCRRGRIVDIDGRSSRSSTSTAALRDRKHVPARGGPLGEGDWTARSYPVPGTRGGGTSDGRDVNNPAVKLGCYAVVEETGGVFVTLG